ncbi:putative membrane protein [Saonia flava]|uniref:Putative membrane protein n=1 Tax=Saonia flava TaxID=523696 RepID=A0A846QXA5_9FLAO|nr:heparan-alpha-glucosaminide N-acetyltransferase domain-containing protein [Saonia flava]NJB70265.1 putative membrane protein [Saonia flava]
MSKTRERIKSIDMLRGLVMVLMALDHVRDYFHYDAFFFDPNDLTQTNGALFFTRFMTHFCAPVFVFLAGTSAFFVGQRRNKKSLSTWLIKRGIWLILAELTIIKFGWLFKLDYSMVLLQVIWILGLGMICLAGFINLPKKPVIISSVLVIIGHNLFDSFAPTGTLSSGIWSFLHVFNIVEVGNMQIFTAYPILPWIFVMPLGYYFGELYRPTVDSNLRIRKLLQIGLGLTLSFFILRFMNIYGDPYFWSNQGTFSFTLISFFNITKYPPSLLFLLLTIGPSIAFLAFAEKWKGAFFDKLIVIGRVPMFFYIIHIYVIHLIALFAALLTGFTASDMMIDVWVTMQAGLQGYGFDLWAVYIIWIILIVLLYPICNWYNQYKNNNRDKWWLSYL